ncbi:hypothetical protein [Granulicella sp. L60]|uniref:hypothetical protein n=1 Tax=Granulicella sp. L60 TaxID=1641866 RepID=UPI00131E0C48|nr:hypothetical protein [Granulicella sp. L60]
MTDLASMNHRRFMLTEGGPTYRLETRVGLIRANSTRILRRALLSILLTWIPLSIFSAVQGYATGHMVPVPFLHDFAVHARFLLAVPLLLLAETLLGPRLAHAASHFVDSGLILEKDFARFDVAIESGLRWRDSTAVEVILICMAYVFTTISLVSTAIHVSTWYAVRGDSGVSLTLSGWWFVLFCVPLFQFLTLRWLWRLFLWAQFLWRMSHLDLQLVPTHPDEAGGLAFLGESQRFFGVVLLAYSIAVAGVLANGVLYDRYPLPHFAPAIAAYVFVAVTIVLIPLLVFSGTLLKTKRLGLYQYGTLGTEYTSSFHKKWITDPCPTGEVLLGTGDIQSLADLGNSFAFVEKMNAVPMGPRTPIHLALACLIPMAPLLLTMMPLAELLKVLFKVIL